MEVSVLKLPSGLARWHLVTSYLVLRREIFIEQKEWDLNQYEGVEYEQYDTVGYSYYVIAHENDKVLAGCRLIRCDSKIGTYTYMIKDAYDGLIDLPPEMCSEPPPEDKHHWELTRLAAVKGNRKATLSVMKACYSFLSAMQAQGCLCLSSPVVERLAKISGYETQPLGPVCGNEDGKFLAFNIPVKPLDFDRVFPHIA